MFLFSLLLLSLLSAPVTVRIILINLLIKFLSCSDEFSRKRRIPYHMPGFWYHFLPNPMEGIKNDTILFLRNAQWSNSWNNNLKVNQPGQILFSERERLAISWRVEVYEEKSCGGAGKYFGVVWSNTTNTSFTTTILMKES